MILGIIVLAMLVGGSAATMALLSGQSVLLALAVYSGCGTVCALLVALAIAARAAFSARHACAPAVSAVAN